MDGGLLTQLSVVTAWTASEISGTDRHVVSVEPFITYLTEAQAGYRLLNDLKIVLPVLSLLLLGTRAGVAPGRLDPPAG